jgi:hypothetical protein
LTSLSIQWHSLLQRLNLLVTFLQVKAKASTAAAAAAAAAVGVSKSLWKGIAATWPENARKGDWTGFALLFLVGWHPM